MNGQSQEALRAETERLHAALAHAGWTATECGLVAPITLRIRELARQQDAVILGHSYQTPDILFGIADYRGDSLGLSRIARDTDARTIVFCGVRFMGETAKVLSPDKRVLLPNPDAGCSLSEAITGADVRRLRAEHPDATFVCYVNTSAEVKAECDVCCTSANALAIVEAAPSDHVVFLPDRYMAQNLAAMTRKRITGYDGRCIVHETFSAESLAAWRERIPGLRILVHTESPPEVVAAADLAGGTGDMVDYVRRSSDPAFMLVTECGLADRMRVEHPDKRFVGTCALCPHMKRVDLRRVLQVLESPRPDQIVEIPADIRDRAALAIERMFEWTARGQDPNRPHSNAGEAQC
jgi:quinolinate synthase